MSTVLFVCLHNAEQVRATRDEIARRVADLLAEL
jgi:hypothetical protein